MPRSLLQMSAQEGTRRVALGYLDQAAEAAERLHDPKDEEALHDFRVAMRRLRSCIRAYRPLLGDAVGKKGRKQLKAIASRTNPGRDAEVQLEWVRRESDPEVARQRPGVEWLAARLAAQRDEAYAHVREDLYERFLKVEAKLRERLKRYTVVHVVGEPEPFGCFADVAAAAMAEQLEELVGDLRRVKGVEDEAIAHRARIHGKRLRYLLEPFRKELEDAKGIVKRLKALQDLLGDLNDLHNLAATVGEALEETALDRARQLREAATEGDGAGDVARALEADERPGLLALLTQIQRDRTRLLDALLKEWLPEGGRLDGLRDDVEALLARMRTGVAPGAAAGPPVEIERKYLLNGLPRTCVGREAVDIDQGYLPGERLVERVRRKRTPDGATYVRTVKVGRGVERIELEEECSAEVFSTLWSLTEGRRVSKRRFVVDAEDGLRWEIDQFTDRALVLAEIELPTADTEVAFPDWLAPYVEREVTDDPAYLNMNLAR